MTLPRISRNGRRRKINGKSFVLKTIGRACRLNKQTRLQNLTPQSATDIVFNELRVSEVDGFDAWLLTNAAPKNLPDSLRRESLRIFAF